MIESNLTAIITIYRNDEQDRRRLQKEEFLEKIKLLKKYGNFDIFLIEQSNDGNNFNIGKLKNIGFDIANKNNKKYNFFVFTDIDILPDKFLSNYYFNKIDGIGCLGVRGTRYGSNNCFTGTCVSFDKKSFKKINGYPNNFWGWGGEDDCIHLRCNINNVKFYTPKKGSIIDLEKNKYGEKITFGEKNQSLKSNNLKENTKKEKIVLDRKIWDNNGLNNLYYKIISSNQYNYDEYDLYNYVVDLSYKKDKKKYPHWYDLSKYNKLSDRENAKLYKKVRRKYLWCKYKSY